MNSSTVGAEAEQLVADLMISEGWKIVSRNWRAPGVEVDLIAETDKRVALVEVKYRSSLGDGFEAIDIRKLTHLERAARLWQNQTNESKEIGIMVASVDAFDAVELVELC